MSRSPTSTSRPSPIWNASSQTVAEASMAISSVSGQTSTGGPSQPPRANQPEIVSLDPPHPTAVAVLRACRVMRRRCWLSRRHDLRRARLASSTASRLYTVPENRLSAALARRWLKQELGSCNDQGQQEQRAKWHQARGSRTSSQARCQAESQSAKDRAGAR